MEIALSQSRLAMLGVLLLLGACSQPEASNTAQNDFSADLQEKIATLDATIPNLMERGGIPGLSIALVKDGEVKWTNAYGVMSTETGELATPETAFEAASLSKPVFTLTFLGAVERGVMDLDTSISERFSYDRLTPDERTQRITPRMVLSHKSGLPNWDREGALDLDREPGVRFGYSGEGFLYLQNAFESETGRRLNSLSNESLFKPLGMKASSFTWRDDYETKLANGHNSDGKPIERNRYTEENAAYSLVTTAADYGAFLAHVMEGATLDGPTFQDMLAIHTSMQGDETKTGHPPEIWQKIHWGLSWGIQEVNGERLYFHWGDNDVYHSFVAFSLADDVGFVYFANSQNGLKIANNLAEIIVGDMTPAITWLGYGGLEDPETG